MGKMKAKWEEEMSFDDSLNDYLYFIYKQKQKEKSSETKIRKISTRRRVDVKNK